MGTTILFHKKCNDGLVAALNFYAFFKERDMLEDVIFRPVQYGEGLPGESILKDRRVYIVDFSYSAIDMAKLTDLAAKTILLDHHESAVHNLFTGEKWLKRVSHTSAEPDEGVYFMSNSNAQILVDKSRSGATLAYREVGMHVQDNRVKDILAYLSSRAEDRDNWVFKYKDSKAVHEYIRSLGFDLAKVYEEVFAGNLTDLLVRVNAAQVRVDMRDEMARNYARLAKPIEFMGYTVPAVNVPSDFSSIVGDILNKDAPFAVMYVVTDQKILLSLRSDKEKGVNVQEIAARLGGGGHIAASGCSLAHTELADFLSGKIQKQFFIDTKETNAIKISLTDFVTDAICDLLHDADHELDQAVAIAVDRTNSLVAKSALLKDKELVRSLVTDYVKEMSFVFKQLKA